MRRSISLILLLTLPYLTFSFNYPYKRLNKLYEAQDEKCLSVAERFIKFFPHNSAPYYYAMAVHFDKAQVQETPRKKYNELSKALSYARSFERIKDKDFEDKMNWADKEDEINIYAEEVITELKEAKLRQLSKALFSKRKRMKWEKVDILNNEEVEVDSGPLVKLDKLEEVERIESVSESNKVDGQYYGLALGTEMILSHSKSSEKKMLDLVNAERKKKGMGQLVWKESLTNAARYHAYDMGSQDYVSHDSQDRKGEKLIEVGGAFDRIRKFHTTSFVNSENIAAGNERAVDTYSQWYHSPGHYHNMFNKSSKEVGIGVVHVPGSTFGYYWVFCTAN